MASTVTCIEEIPSNDFKVPQICLKIISLNLNDRGESLTPPPPPLSASAESGALKPYVHPPAIVRRQLHKLQSYDHLLYDLHQSYMRKMGYSSRSRQSAPRNKPSLDSSSGDSSDNHWDNKAQSSEQQLPDYNATYVFFIKGMNNIVCGDRQKMISTIVHLLNKHVVSVGMKEHKLLQNGRPLHPKSTLKHALVQSALLAINEVIDQGVLDISRMGTVQVGQCLAFSVFFHKNVLHLGRQAWDSAYAHMIREAWMSFGCVGAVVFLSSMRQ